MVKRDLLMLAALFLCVAVFASVYYFLKGRKREKEIRALGVLGALASCGIFLFLAVFSRSAHEVEIELMPFWSYKASVSQYYALDVFLQIVENVGIFVPTGFLLSFLFGERERGGRVIFLSFLLSLFAEVCQFLFSLGVCETDDLFNNTLGAVVGYGLYRSMTAAEIRGKRFEITDEKRFLKGLFPLLAVYELFVFLLVLREILK